MLLRTIIPLFLLIGALSGCGDEPAAPVTQSSAAAPTLSPFEARGRAAFGECAVCHTVEKGGRHMVGPNLWGVHGAQAAAKADFAYSKAMQRSGLLWDEETLGAYLENPQTVVPGTRMAYRGLGDDEARAALIAYLSTLKDAG